jgi:hypothetical protein
VTTIIAPTTISCSDLSEFGSRPPVQLLKGMPPDVCAAFLLDCTDDGCSVVTLSTHTAPHACLRTSELCSTLNQLPELMIRRCKLASEFKGESRPYHWENYGGANSPVRVCKRWQKFVNFLADLGEAPTGNLCRERWTWATTLRATRRGALAQNSRSKPQRNVGNLAIVEDAFSRGTEAKHLMKEVSHASGTESH